jgi:hypothetical protein
MNGCPLDQNYTPSFLFSLIFTSITAIYYVSGRFGGIVCLESGEDEAIGLILLPRKPLPTKAIDSTRDAGPSDANSPSIPW